MDDNQSQNANLSPRIDAGEAGKTQNLVQTQTDQTQTISTQAVPNPTLQGQVGLPQKEQEPLAVWEQSKRDLIEQAPLEKGPEVDQELAEAGIEKVHDKPHLTLEDKKAGIRLAKESVEVKTASSGLVNMPLTEEEAKRVLKVHKKISDSVVWLAAEIVKQFKIMHKKMIRN